MDRRKRRRFLSALQSGILEEIRSISNTAIASFTGDGRDLVRLVVGIEPVQSGSGDPSPDNVRPISGWTECKVTRIGKNLLKALYSGRTNNGVTYAIDADGVISLSGIANGSSYAAPNLSGDTSQMMYLKAGTYTLSGGISSAIRLYFGGKDIDGGGLSGIGYDTGNGLTYTFSKDVWLYPQIVVASGTDTTGKSVKPMLVLGNTATAYEPYQGQTYTIDLDGTRYGGTLDVTSGKLTVTDGYIASYDGETLPSTWISDRDVYAAGTNPTNGAEVVYKLATPIEVDLTPTQITTLSGVNNIWADTGDIILLEYMA